ncbi:MAG: pyridoxal-dependent decarboxylase [Pyrinomonadaceae bacterium]
MNERYELIPSDLMRALAEDRASGKLPFCVVATVGSTSCTSIDPIARIADICESERLWLHVDAAHGGAAAGVPEMKWILDGAERADSFVINPHKWLFVPLDCSVLYLRKPDILRRAMSVVPEYLNTPDRNKSVDFMDYGIPLGRRFRALKLWFVLRYFGSAGIQNRIREHIRLGRLFSGWVDANPCLELLAPVPLSTVCFRAILSDAQSEKELDILNETLLKRLNHSGRFFLSHTKLAGRYAVRVVVSHINSNEENLRSLFAMIEDEVSELCS